MQNDSAFYPLHIFRILQFETAGDLVGSLKLMFRHIDFQPSPIVPLAFFLHERKLQCTHESFFKYIQSVIPDKATNMYMVTDGKRAIHLAITTYFPNLKTFRCWNHTCHKLKLWGIFAVLINDSWKYKVVISPISVHFWWWDNKTNMACLFRALVLFNALW